MLNIQHTATARKVLEIILTREKNWSTDWQVTKCRPMHVKGRRMPRAIVQWIGHWLMHPPPAAVTPDMTTPPNTHKNEHHVWSITCFLKCHLTIFISWGHANYTAPTTKLGQLGHVLLQKVFLFFCFFFVCVFVAGMLPTFFSFILHHLNTMGGEDITARLKPLVT